MEASGSFHGRSDENIREIRTKATSEAPTKSSANPSTKASVEVIDTEAIGTFTKASNFQESFHESFQGSNVYERVHERFHEILHGSYFHAVFPESFHTLYIYIFLHFSGRQILF